MLTLTEARLLQKKRERACLLRFLSIIVVIIVVTALIGVFTGCFKERPVLYIFPLLAVAVTVKYSGVTRFAELKEFTGIIQSRNIYTVHVKTYASHQAGVAYKSNERTMMEIVAKSDTGKAVIKNFEYSEYYADLKEGDTVCFLRFVDGPVLRSNSNKVN